ncbi:MAG: glutathione synthase [Ruminococcus sp.]|nr:glutathione synthase [Ruminococcus sp.]
MSDKLFYKGKFGLERETLRVDINGRLAQTPHPFTEDGNITRDFCENQIELITPVCNSVDEVMDELDKLDSKVRNKITKNGESIWLYSNPPHFDSEDEIPVANFTGEHTGKRIYREQLSRRYGKKLMLFSGIHFNFSFDDEYLKTLYNGPDFDFWRDEFYLSLYKKLSLNSWLLLLLTAASPVCDRSLLGEAADGTTESGYSSIRSGDKGYWNDEIPILDHRNLKSFVDSIQSYVDSGKLFSASELYFPVRLKPKGINHIDNFKNGISHIELRMFDLNPLTKLGIDKRDLEFAHLLIMYLSAQPDFEYTSDLQKRAVINHKNAALYDLSDVKIDNENIIDRAQSKLCEMADFFCKDDEAAKIIEFEIQKLTNRLCEQITNIYRQKVTKCASFSGCLHTEKQT